MQRGSNQTAGNKGGDMFGFTNEKIRKAIFELPGAQEVRQAATKSRPAAGKDDKAGQQRQDDKVRPVHAELDMPFSCGCSLLTCMALLMCMLVCACLCAGRRSHQGAETAGEAARLQRQERRSLRAACRDGVGIRQLPRLHMLETRMR